MSPFSVPLDANFTRPSSRKRAYPVPITASRKRKRASSRSPSPSSSRAASTGPHSDDEAGAPTISAAIRNPLALSPDEIRQYRVAGVEINQELNDDFWREYHPHRNIGKRSPFLKNRAGEKQDLAVKPDKISSIKIQHVTNLTTLLQRCLQEGDIARASRAWALLLRTQVNGHAIELRESGYWGIGAELIVRAGEQAPIGKRGLDGRIRETTKEHNDTPGDSKELDVGDHGEVKRWGSRAGLEAVKDYYERLALQYPYRRQFGDTVNALDFWAAGSGCEVYGIQYEQQAALRKLKKQGEDDDFTPSDVGLTDTEELEEGEDFYQAQDRREKVRKQKMHDYFWHKKDEIRRHTILEAERLAMRIDNLMKLPPYSDSHVLLRSRGMLSLYICQLHVPEYEGDEDHEDDQASQDSAARLLARQRRMEHERGLNERAKEWGKSRDMFRRIRKAGDKDLDEVLKRLGANDEDESVSDRRSDHDMSD